MAQQRRLRVRQRSQGPADRLFDHAGQCQIYAWMVVFIRGLVIDQDKRAASMSHCGFPKILKKRYPYALWLIGYQSESCRHCIAFTSDTLNDVLRVLS